MSASMVESIKFIRFPGICEYGKRHDQYQIRWTDPNGIITTNHTYWCSHPFCDTSPLRLSSSPPEVKLTSWIDDCRTLPIAVAYLLLLHDPEGRTLPQMAARIGICDQWQDVRWGNVGSQFTERYFAESGPGVYPAPIVHAPELSKSTEGPPCPPPN